MAPSGDEVAPAEVRAVFERHRVRLPAGRAEGFARYLSLLERWNQSLNLTSIRDRERAILRHFVEPAMALPLLAGAGPCHVDVGSGAGFPGLVLNVLEPERECILVESSARKATFLHEVIEALELENARVLTGRLEELIRDEELQGPVHLLTTRAWTGGYGPLLGIMAGLMAPGGRAVLWIGEETLREVRRNLVTAGGPPQAKERAWTRAVRAGWEIRRLMTLPHLDRGYAVSLELPS